MMDTSTDIRKIRAELATLFEPDHLHLREYVNLHGPAPTTPPETVYAS